MSKYSNAFKLMVVKTWLSGQNSLTELVKPYDISSDHMIYEWCNAYEITDSIKFKTHKVYLPKFKMKVLN